MCCRKFFRWQPDGSKELKGTKMRYLSFLAAVLASAPACAAEPTHTIELRPGLVERWQAPRPFVNVIIGNTDIVDALPGNNQELIIMTKPDGGSTNIALIDENGEQVANVLVINPAIQYLPARSAETGMQVYRNEDKCWPVCARMPKPNDRAPTKRDDTAQSNAQQPNSQGK
jgi:putative type II/III system pilus formation protein